VAFVTLNAFSSARVSFLGSASHSSLELEFRMDSKRPVTIAEYRYDVGTTSVGEQPLLSKLKQDDGNSGFVFNLRLNLTFP
jgi:hypothetical protein